MSLPNRLGISTRDYHIFHTAVQHLFFLPLLASFLLLLSFFPRRLILFPASLSSDQRPSDFSDSISLSRLRIGRRPKHLGSSSAYNISRLVASQTTLRIAAYRCGQPDRERRGPPSTKHLPARRR